MYRPRMGQALTIIISALFTVPLHAQALAITPAAGNSASTINSSGTPSASTQSNGSLDFSLMNWRMGALSPYSRSSLIGSATTASTESVSSTPTTNTSNPFVGPTIGMNGGLTTTPTPSSSSASASTNFSTPTLQLNNARPSTWSNNLYFASRFVSYDDLKPDYGLNNSLVTPAESNSGLSNLVPVVTNDFGKLASVPEPGTLVLCGGLLAIAGYSWARRKTKEQPKLDADEASKQDEATTVVE